MLNTYLLPVYQDGDCWIDKCFAPDSETAEEKFIESFIEEFELDDNILEWDQLVKRLAADNIYIGDVYDKEEFQY